MQGELVVLREQCVLAYDEQQDSQSKLTHMAQWRAFVEVRHACLPQPTTSEVSGLPASSASAPQPGQQQQQARNSPSGQCARTACS
jgi:hypothetical protein